MEGGWGSEHINHQNGGEVDNGQEKGAESGKGRVLLRSESGHHGERQDKGGPSGNLNCLDSLSVSDTSMP